MSQHSMEDDFSHFVQLLVEIVTLTSRFMEEKINILQLYSLLYVCVYMYMYYKYVHV